MHAFYRISDASYPKMKLPGCTKKYCLSRFTHEFWWDDIYYTIIADRCSESLEYVRDHIWKDSRVETDLGNAGSFRRTLRMASLLPDDEIVYFVEDDYFHGGGCANVIMDAPPYDYWTAFDHPDKYEKQYGHGEIGKVIRTKHCHWRETISTTMTFASRAGTIKRDMDIWLKYTEGDHPQDHFAFEHLNRLGRKLVCAIPGRAWHTDLTESFKAGKLMFDIDCLYELVNDLARYAGYYYEDGGEHADYIDELTWQVTQAYETEDKMKALVPLIELEKKLKEKKSRCH